MVSYLELYLFSHCSNLNSYKFFVELHHQVEHILLKNSIIHGSIKSKLLTITWSINNDFLYSYFK